MHLGLKRSALWLSRGWRQGCRSGSCRLVDGKDRARQGTRQDHQRWQGQGFLGLPYAAPPVGDLRWKAPSRRSLEG